MGVSRQGPPSGPHGGGRRPRCLQRPRQAVEDRAQREVATRPPPHLRAAAPARDRTGPPSRPRTSGMAPRRRADAAGRCPTGGGRRPCRPLRSTLEASLPLVCCPGGGRGAEQRARLPWALAWDGCPRGTGCRAHSSLLPLRLLGPRAECRPGQGRPGRLSPTGQESRLGARWPRAGSHAWETASAVGWAPGAHAASGAPGKVSCLFGGRGPARGTATLSAFGAEDQRASRAAGPGGRTSGPTSTKLQVTLRRKGRREGAHRWASSPPSRMRVVQHPGGKKGHSTNRPPRVATRLDQRGPLGGGRGEAALCGHGSRSRNSARWGVLLTHTHTHPFVCITVNYRGSLLQLTARQRDSVSMGGQACPGGPRPARTRPPSALARPCPLVVTVYGCCN